MKNKLVQKITWKSGVKSRAGITPSLSALSVPKYETSARKEPQKWYIGITCALSSLSLKFFAWKNFFYFFLKFPIFSQETAFLIFREMELSSAKRFLFKKGTWNARITKKEIPLSRNFLYFSKTSSPHILDDFRSICKIKKIPYTPGSLLILSNEFFELAWKNWLFTNKNVFYVFWMCFGCGSTILFWQNIAIRLF